MIVLYSEWHFTTRHFAICSLSIFTVPWSFYICFDLDCVQVSRMFSFRNRNFVSKQIWSHLLLICSNLANILRITTCLFFIFWIGWQSIAQCGTFTHH